MLSETRENIKEFYDFITEYPLLGLHHKAGVQLEKEIRELPLYSVENEIWYRAKAPDSTRIFTQKDMMPPLPEDTREGRYNHYGLPCLYASENEETCASEIRREGESGVLCWIQKIKINGAKVIDLTAPQKLNDPDCFLLEGLLLTQTIVIHPSEKRKYYKPEYKITRFIADLCRLYKIDGIKYPSAVSKKSGASQDQDGISSCNIVLFDTKGKLFTFEGEPYVFKE